jgi:alanyl-tRNA synthetase
LDEAATGKSRSSFARRGSDGKVPAGQVIKELAPIIGGRGGGKADMAEGGGNQPRNLPAALEKSYEVVETVAN